MIKLPFSYDGFTYAKTTAYPEFIALLDNSGMVKTQVGVDSDDNPIYAIKTGSGKHTIMITSGVHGHHEWRSPHYVVEFMRMLHNNDAPLFGFANWLKSKFTFYAIPLVTPYAYYADTYVNANGANVYCNADINWDTYTSPIYRGSAPWSEPEARAWRDAALTQKPVLIVDCHTLGSDNVASGGRMGDYSDGLFIKSIAQSVNLSMGRQDILAQDLQGESDLLSWAHKNVVSTLGTKTMAMYQEAQYMQTEQIQAKIGITSLMVISFWVAKFLETRTVLN